MDKYICKSETGLATLICKGRARSSDMVNEHLLQIKEQKNKLNAFISILKAEASLEGVLYDK